MDMSKVNYELLFTIFREMFREELAKQTVTSHSELMAAFDKASLRAMVAYARKTELNQ